MYLPFDVHEREALARKNHNGIVPLARRGCRRRGHRRRQGAFAQEDLLDVGPASSTRGMPTVVDADDTRECCSENSSAFNQTETPPRELALQGFGDASVNGNPT